MTTVALRHGDCLDVLRELPDASVDAIITDPPYGLEFMGRRDWDSQVPGVAYWAECLRVAKPGAHLAAFGGTRTVHRLTVAIEDAGFEIRDSIMWIYGSGFPKGQNVGKAIDKAAGAEREVIGFDESVRARRPNVQCLSTLPGGLYRWGDEHYAWEDLPPAGKRWLEDRLEKTGQITSPATPEAAQWEGWNTALKPAHEPIIVARKPFKASVAANVLEHGTGGLHVDACRVGTEPIERGRAGRSDCVTGSMGGGDLSPTVERSYAAGRWPANVILSHAPECPPSGECDGSCPVAELDAQSGNRKSAPFHEGGASRFFASFRYQAKAPKAERPTIDGKGWPTVKPQGICRWLAKLLCPPGGTILDPFAGTAATLQAARDEGFASIGIERDPFAYRLACQRLGLPDPEAAA